MMKPAIYAAALTALSWIGVSPAQLSDFAPSWSSLRTHQVPQLFKDAKFVIFIHWGPYSVPGWAPPEGTYGQMDFNDFLQRNPYAEWYLNSLRIIGSPTWDYHRGSHGKKFPR